MEVETKETRGLICDPLRSSVKGLMILRHAYEQKFSSVITLYIESFCQHRAAASNSSCYFDYGAYI